MFLTELMYVLISFNCWLIRPRSGRKWNSLPGNLHINQILVDHSNNPGWDFAKRLNRMRACTRAGLYCCWAHTLLISNSEWLDQLSKYGWASAPINIANNMMERWRKMWACLFCSKHANLRSHLQSVTLLLAVVFLTGSKFKTFCLVFLYFNFNFIQFSFEHFYSFHKFNPRESEMHTMQRVHASTVSEQMY